MITGRLERGAERLRRAAGESVLLNAFFHGGDTGQTAGQNGSGRRAVLRFRVMRWQETSFARRRLNAVWAALLRSSVGSLAGIPFGAAASALILYFLRGGRGAVAFRLPAARATDRAVSVRLLRAVSRPFRRGRDGWRAPPRDAPRRACGRGAVAGSAADLSAAFVRSAVPVVSLPRSSRTERIASCAFLSVSAASATHDRPACVRRCVVHGGVLREVAERTAGIPL